MSARLLPQSRYTEAIVAYLQVGASRHLYRVCRRTVHTNAHLSLQGPRFSTPLLSFIDENCLTFVPNSEDPDYKSVRAQLVMALWKHQLYVCNAFLSCFALSHTSKPPVLYAIWQECE